MTARRTPSPLQALLLLLPRGRELKPPQFAGSIDPRSHVRSQQWRVEAAPSGAAILGKKSREVAVKEPL